jgi:hypothetical protein
VNKKKVNTKTDNKPFKKWRKKVIGPYHIWTSGFRGHNLRLKQMSTPVRTYK